MPSIADAIADPLQTAHEKFCNEPSEFYPKPNPNDRYLKHNEISRMRLSLLTK